MLWVIVGSDLIIFCNISLSQPPAWPIFPHLKKLPGKSLFVFKLRFNWNVENESLFLFLNHKRFNKLIGTALSNNNVVEMESNKLFFISTSLALSLISMHKKNWSSYCREGLSIQKMYMYKMYMYMYIYVERERERI